MEFKRISSKGGLNIPVKLRRNMGIENGDPMELEINEKNELVVRYYTPRCIFCTAHDIVLTKNGKGICSECLNNIKMLEEAK